MPEVPALKDERAAEMDAIPQRTKKHSLVRSLTHDSQATFSRRYSSAKNFIQRELYKPTKLDRLMAILRNQPAALVQRLAEHESDGRGAPPAETLRTVTTKD